MAARSLTQHSLVSTSLRKAIAVQQSLGDKAVMKTKPDYSREPDEHEFFLLGVGTALAEVLTTFEHLTYLPVFLANYSPTPAMERKGINRHKHLTYHIESYLVRTQGVLDRILKLVDAIFHLLNDPKQCREAVILNNQKVKRTKIPNIIKNLRKLLSRYSADRNQIVHHHSVTNDELRRLEMLYIYSDILTKEGDPDIGNVKELRRELTSKVVQSKKREFSAFNIDLEEALNAVFDSLEHHFNLEERSLLRKLGKSAT